MRFGVCTGPDRVDAVLDAGYDYIEVGASGFGGLEVAEDLSGYEYRGIEATNVFFPREIRLFGPEATPWEPYTERTIERASKLGVKTMVVGSGGARQIPEGHDVAACEADFVKIAGQMAKMAEPYGIAIAVEPLNAKECNLGNDQGKLARALADQGCGYCVDTFHLLHWWAGLTPMEPSPSKRFLNDQIPFLPVHVHLSDFPARSWPKKEDVVVKACIDRLLELGYDGRMSLECSLAWPEDLKPALEAMKALTGN